MSETDRGGAGRPRGHRGGPRADACPGRGDPAERDRGRRAGRRAPRRVRVAPDDDRGGAEAPRLPGERRERHEVQPLARQDRELPPRRFRLSLVPQLRLLLPVALRQRRRGAAHRRVPRGRRRGSSNAAASQRSRTSATSSTTGRTAARTSNWSSRSRLARSRRSAATRRDPSADRGSSTATASTRRPSSAARGSSATGLPTTAPEPPQQAAVVQCAPWRASSR